MECQQPRARRTTENSGKICSSQFSPARILARKMPLLKRINGDSHPGYATCRACPCFHSFAAWVIRNGELLDPNWDWKKRQFQGAGAVAEDYEPKELHCRVSRRKGLDKAGTNRNGSRGRLRHQHSAAYPPTKLASKRVRGVVQSRQPGPWLQPDVAGPAYLLAKGRCTGLRSLPVEGPERLTSFKLPSEALLPRVGLCRQEKAVELKQRCALVQGRDHLSSARPHIPRQQWRWNW